MNGLGPEVLTAGKAIGILDDGGLPSASWFDQPIAALESIFTSPTQRAALLNLLDQLFPAQPPGPLTPANEKWHPLLGDQPAGNIYLTIANGAAPLTLGIAGDLHSTTSPNPAALRCHLPVAKIDGDSVAAVAGTADGPLQLELRVELDWSRNTGQSIDLHAIRLSASLSPLAASPFSVAVVLEGFSIDTRPPADTKLDPSQLDAAAMQVVIGLIREQLTQASGLTGEAATVAQNLLPVLGLAAGFPAFPFADPSTVRNWLASIASAGKLAEWVGHLGALLGGSNSIEGTGTSVDPWRVTVLQIDTNSPLELTVARVTAVHSNTPSLEIGLQARYLPAGPNPAVRIDVQAVFVSVPLQGLDAVSVIPRASIAMAAPGDATQSLISSSDISVGTLRAGAQWDGSKIAPLLELDGVTFTFQGVTKRYDQLDLSHADAVVAAASDLVLAAIQAVIGTTDAGAHLAALIGIAKPAGDPAWTHLADVATLVSNPTKAIAAVHRASLLDPTHSWKFLFAEIAESFGISDPVAGTGTADDPWRVPLDSDSIAVELAAWNARQSTNTADPEQLRIGVRLSVANDPWNLSWLAELLAFDLPASGSAAIALLGAQHARLQLAPIPMPPETAGVAISADSLALQLEWSPGNALQIQAVLANLTVVADSSTIHVPALAFPPPAAFDFSNPQPTLGISATDLQTLFRALLSRGALSWAGTDGLTLAALFGLHGDLPGLQSDWPLLTGSFFSDPSEALRTWLGKLITSQSADGSPFLPNALAWLQAFLGNTRPELDAPAPDAVGGSGSYDDPWAVELAPGVELLTWLEPSGPPSAWATGIANLIATHEFYDELVQWGETFGSLVPTAQEALTKQDIGQLVAGLTALEGWFLSTDGFVAVESQTPSGATWTSGTAVAAAHLQQPSNPAAISQINAQISTWNPLTKVVLLLGPAFSDHTIWNNLLGGITVKPNFNLRVPGTDPQSVDLDGVTDVADFYTCDLAPGDLASVTAQIGRVVARIAELRPSISVTLVAHSTAGIAARAFTAANPSAVHGLITLGTPHLGSPLLPILDASAASAIRTIHELTPTLPTGPLRDALDAITSALDNLLPSFSADAFQAPATQDTGGVPALAIPGTVGVSLFVQMKQALHDLATASAAATKPAPTHLAFGARIHLDFGEDGEIETDVALRCDSARLALQPGAPEPPRAARGYGAQISLSRPGDWLAGSAASNTRVRWAELGITTASTSSLVPFVRLHGAAFESPALGVVDLTHPQAQVLLGTLFHSVSDLAADAGPAFTSVLNLLGTLGITVADPHGGVALSLDTFRALTTDPKGYLGPRLGPALTQTLVLPDPFHFYVDGSTAGVRTDSIAFSSLAGASVDARVSLTSLQPSLDLTFTVGSATLQFAHSTGRLTLVAPPWIDPLVLIPLPPASQIEAAFKHAIPRLLLSAAASAAIEAALETDVGIGPLVALLEDPGAFLVSTSALGDGRCLDAGRITNLLETIADLRGVVASPQLALPAGLQLGATGSDPVEVAISTATPIGGILDLQLAARIDCSRHVTPAGAATLNLALPGSWPSLAIAFGVDPSGVSLILTPQTDPPIAPIQLLPKFSGLGPLLGTAAALLPSALDKLVDAVDPSTLRDDTLAVGQAFGLYDPAGKFSAHADAWRALTQGDWSSALSSGIQTTAAAALAKVLGHAAGSVTVSGRTAVIQVGNDFRAALGWDSGPSLSLTTTALKAANGALTSDIALGFAAGKPLANVTLALNLESSIGVIVTPALKMAYDGASLGIGLLPLGTANEAILAVDLAPTPAIRHSADFASHLASEWILPVASEPLVRAAKPHFALNVWTGGPTLQDLLTRVGVIASTGDLATPLPSVDTLVHNLVSAFASQAEVAISGFKLKFISDTTGLGVNLRGSLDLPLSGVDLQVRFENPSLPTAHPGVSIYLFNPAGSFAPELSISGLGFALEGPGGTPLINNSGFRMQGAGGNLFFDFNSSIQNFGAALDVKGLGIPLGLLGGDHDGGNPVASSLLQGAQATNDDPEPVNPAIDVTVSYLNENFGIQLGGPAPPVWIAVHRSFGPIYIDQLGVSWNANAADLLVDATIKVAALTVQTFELGLHIPFKRLLDPTKWSLDLQGLAVGFDASPVTIAGGLIKNPGPPVEYDGVLTAEIAGRGLTVVGSYARPTDAFGGYTSMSIFVSLPTTLGGPPYLFVTGLGGGAAYNRELIPPTDINEVPDFFLVSAIDDASLANNPMSALTSMGAFVPPRRGGYWLAAGVRFNSFVVVNSVVVAYVALDRGFELGVLGVSRLQLPMDDPLVNIEMALKARFSSAEQTLLIQAQLTDHSWLLSQDCQLTGGYAFFIWFPQGHVALTIGGYHPSFQKPPEFPDVPRLGFRWQVADGIQIKGESYFAITSSGYMCGGRLEASASIDGISAWFTVHLDILIQWDPFHYDFLGGIEVGVSLKIEVCFFGACASVSISISRGADIHIFGKPFHADVTFDAYVTSITLSFGGDPQPVPDALPWPTFRDKYLISGNAANTWVAVRVVKGLIPTEPPGAQPSPGTVAQPLKFTPEFSLITESRMPVSGYSVTATTLDQSGAVIPVTLTSKTDAKLFDLAPMQKLKVGSVHTATFAPALTHPDLFTVEEIIDLLPEATWRWYDPTHLPAAANRIRAITGLRITGVAQLQGKSTLIPISTLVDDDPRFARPLPFASVAVSTGALQTAGLAADAVAALATTAPSNKSIAAANTVLTGGGFFAQARAAVGLPSNGISPISARALNRDRSAPPLLTPLSTGLTMKNVGLAKPPIFSAPVQSSAVSLSQVRLKAVLQSRPVPAADAPATPRTTAVNVSVRNAPRMSAPKLSMVPGAKLQMVAAAKAAPPTSLASPARSMRTFEIGALTGKTHAANFSAAAQSLMQSGVSIPAGVTHVWDLTGTAAVFEFTGGASIRVVYLDRAGNILQDTESVVSGKLASSAPAGAEMAVFTCLGAVTSGVTLASGFGTVTSGSAPANGISATGWQVGNSFPQVGPATILTRGAVMRLHKPLVATSNRQKTTLGMTEISAATAQQPGTETWLPKDTSVVMILLDRQDPTAASAGDLTIACPDATFAAPIIGASGDRSALLYDVVSRNANASRVTISVVSKAGWRLAGVIGLHGSSAEWASQMNGNVPPNPIADGPLAPGGALTVRFTSGGVQ
jgi:large repetitive protein